MKAIGLFALAFWSVAAAAGAADSMSSGPSEAAERLDLLVAEANRSFDAKVAERLDRRVQSLFDHAVSETAGPRTGFIVRGRLIEPGPIVQQVVAPASNDE